jgi:hypothetical protein
MYGLSENLVLTYASLIFVGTTETLCSEISENAHGPSYSLQQQGAY